MIQQKRSAQEREISIKLNSLKQKYIFLWVFWILISGCSHKQKETSDSKIKKEVPIDTSGYKNLEYFGNLDSAILNPRKVGHLSLRENDYLEFPKEIFEFQNLRSLDISMNSIEIIPPEIKKLTQLESLVMAYCSLYTISKEIGELQNLRSLDLLDNNLSAIPESIGNLHSLEKLNLTMNPLIELPSSISNLENLKNLSLQGNKVRKFSEEEKQEIEDSLPHCKIYFD